MCEDCGCLHNWSNDIYENEDRWYDIGIEPEEPDDDDEDAEDE
jgi:hypothetical protein